MPKKRTLIQKLKDEAKQIREGFRNVGGRYSSSMTKDVQDFRSGYKKETQRQRKKRRTSKSETTFKHGGTFRHSNGLEQHD